MEKKPPPDIPGETPFERFENALRCVLRASKSDIDKLEAKRLRRKKLLSKR